MYKNLIKITTIVIFLGSLFLGGVSMSAEINKEVVVDTNITEKQQKVFVDPLSARSLYLILAYGEEILGTATGFVVEKDKKFYLITNWHVISGRNPESNLILAPSGKTPNRILIWHHGKTLGTWILKKEDLYDESGEKRWKEHAKGKKIDLVALPLTGISDDIQIYSFDLALTKTDMVPQVAMPVSIIGFPLGFSGPGRFPIWKTGHIASEPELDYNNEPLFLIDATTRGGMSGSPVVLRLSGGYKMKSGGSIIGSSGTATLFLGVYSGRISDDAEIGRVWRPYLIEEILR